MNEKSFKFSYQDLEAVYVSDNSEIWDSGFRDCESLNLLDAVLRGIAESLKDDRRKNAVPMLLAVIRNARRAVIWKHFIETATLNISSMYDLALPLLAIPKLISAPEVTVAVGNLITSAYENHLVSDRDAFVIESAIEAIPGTDLILRYEKPESVRNRLMRCIPEDQLRSSRLKELSASLKAEAVRKNEPFFSTSFSAGQFTNEDWLKERGVDTTTPENSRVLEALSPLRDFEHKYLNEVPSVEQCERAEKLLVAAEAELNGITLPDALEEQAVGIVCAVAKNILKNAQLSIDSSAVQLCRKLALAGVQNAFPKFDPEYHSKFDSPGWGSLQPRIEAAQAIGHFIWNWGIDEEVRSAFVTLSQDKVPAVRYQVSIFLPGFYKHKAIEEFWSLTTAMVTKEPTVGVTLGLVGALGRVASLAPKRVVELLTLATKKGLPQTERRELMHEIIKILAGLYIARDELSAVEMLLTFESDPVAFHREVTEEVLVASAYLSPPNGSEPETRARAREVLERILLAVYRALEKVEKAEHSEERTKAFRELLMIQDEVATRVHFALEPKQTGPIAAEGTFDELEARYFELKPILQLLTSTATVSGRQHYLAPHTAHYLMETMNSVLDFDPGAVVVFASAICRAASRLSYQFDSMAVAETVKFVDRVLADYKDILRDPTVADALGTILDIFVSAGWPQALQLTFTLDQAIR